MSVTVGDLLKLELLKDAKVIAGEKGLSREVERLNFTDCPIRFEESEYALVGKGDLYLRSLYMIKDSEKDLYEAFYFYIKTQSSGCIVTDAYLSDAKLPGSVIELADEKRYPILMISDEVQYGELIRQISEILLMDRSEMIAENKLNRLLYDHMEPKESEAIAKYLNAGFLACYAACYFEAPELDTHDWSMIFGELKKNHSLVPQRYQRGAFVILNGSFSKDCKVLGERVIQSVSHIDHCTFGISGVFTSVADFSRCLHQALFSFSMAGAVGEPVVTHDEVSLYHVLFPIRDQEYLSEFCRSMIDPLAEYGRSHRVDLLETVEEYIKNDGDYKKTAATLFTHENTVRFRITKAKNLLGFEQSHFKFIEHMSVALKAYKLMQIPKE